MILLFGAVANPAVAFLCVRLADRHRDFLLLDIRQARFGTRDIWWRGDGRGLRGEILVDERRRVDLDDVTAIYFHQLAVVRELRASSPEGRRYQGLCSWLELTSAVVVNRPAAAVWAGSKPAQYPILRKHGFRVPRTLISNNPGDVRRFYETCDGRVIFKTVSGQRSRVQWLDSEALQDLDRLVHGPVLFQEYVPGDDVRVHVVGGRVFGTRIGSPAVDYRYGRKTMSPCDLAPALAEACRDIAREMGLVMCSVDLRRDPEGRHSCFEVNPNPGFSYYQAVTGQAVGDALADVLCGARETSSSL